MSLRIISIDPSGDGATAFVVGDIIDKEIELVDFGIIDYKDKDETEKFFTTKEFIKYIRKVDVDVVVIEDYIQYRNQIGKFGSTFPTSELIGALEYKLFELKKPIVRQKASSLRENYVTQYRDTIDAKTGEHIRRALPKNFKPYLTKEQLKSDGYLKSGKHNTTQIIVNDIGYNLKDYQVGSKNDHIIMALRHLIEANVSQDWEQIIEKHKEIRERKR